MVATATKPKDASVPPPPPPPDPNGPDVQNVGDDSTYISQLEKERGLPDGLLRDVIYKGERSGDDAVSPKGAIGIGQLMPATAKGLGVDPHDHKQNLRGAADYLAEGWNKYKDPTKAVAYYHGGPNEKIWGPKTHAYVDKVTGKALDKGAAQQGDDGSGGLMSDISKAEKAAAASDEKLKAYLQDHETRFKALEGQYNDAIEQERKLADTTFLPKPPTPPKAVQTKPMDVMRQFVPVLIALGGLKTRAPGTAVLNAMAAAVEARQKNDTEAFKKANEEFKNNLDLMHEQWAEVREKAKDAFENTRLTAEDRVNQLRMMAVEMGNETMLNQIDHGKLDDAWKHYQMWEAANYHTGLVRVGQMKAEAVQGMNAQKAEQSQAYEQAADEIKRSPEFRAASKVDQAKMLAGLTRSLMPNDPYKIQQAASRVRHEIDTGPVGKAYGQAEQFMPTITNVAGRLDKASFWNNPIGSQEQAAFLDAFTKLVTGGQAIRGFTLKLNTEHAGLGDKVSILLQQAKTGGPLSVRQMKEMARVAEDYAGVIAKLYDQEVDKGEKITEGMGAAPGLGTPLNAGALDSELVPAPDSGTTPPAATDRFHGFSATPSS